MILDPQSIIGSTFDECTFGRMWIRLSFTCSSGGRISMDTNHSLHYSEGPLNRNSENSEIRGALLGVYDCLESTVTSIDVSYEIARLVFSSGGILDLIREGDEDNLFLLRDLESNSWAAFE